MSESWAPWAFGARSCSGWCPALGAGGGAKIRGYADNQSNEALLRKAMTTKFPSTLILIELAEELYLPRTVSSSYSGSDGT